MKKSWVAVVALAVFLGVLFLALPAKEEREYVRIHIRAHSDQKEDQDIKFLVRDTVVDALIPLLASCETYEEAKKTLMESLPSLESAANAVLQRAGKTYAAKVTMIREEFPARKYGAFTLKQGVYDAVIIDLGAANGANWWCVAFPPLCFIPADNGKNRIYRSKILEIVEKHF